MKKNYLKKGFAALASCVLMASAMPLVPMSNIFAAENLFTNGEFNNGTTDWGTYKESGGACKLTTENGKLALKVTNQGTLNYAVQMCYDQPVALYKNGVYRLSYEISSTVPRFVESMIQQNGGKYTAYTWKGIDVTTEPQKVEYEFEMEYDTDIMTKFCFNCGLQEKEDGGPVGEHTIYLDNVVLELIDDSKVDYNANAPYAPPIITNQIGYRPDAKKFAVIRNADAVNTNEFSVVNADTKEVAYHGVVSENINNSQANEMNYVADFSELKTPGKYYVSYGGLDNSYTFEIGDNVYNNLLDASVRMLYLQRCGTEVKDDKFGHASCHDTMATIYHTDEKIDVNGGWHDAGDYGRYIVPAAKAVADLMYAYMANPSDYSDNIGIPESGNGTADVLDEVRYELEWMLKMQSKSTGGVYHKVSCDTFPGYVMPEKETKPLIVMPETVTSSADFAASMALAYEVYKDIDANFANTCLEAAKKAYEWAKANPDKLYLANPNDIVTGAYEDKSAADEMYWAAAQLYRATGEKSYMDGVAVKTGLDWATVGDYGNIAILTMKEIDKNSDIYTNALSAVKKQADTLASASSANPYGSSLTKYNWGSNMTIANAGIILNLAYKLTGEAKYLDASTAQLDYLLGSNPLGTSFVTGYGTVSPENPHHRPSMAVGSAMPGMLVGGVNQGLEDPAAKAYCKKSAPAKCWVDNSESYSTNEITIYWNSPLTYLITLTGDTSANNNQGTTNPTNPSNPNGDVLYGDANCDGDVNIADATAIIQALGNKDKYGLSDKGKVNGDCYNVGDGVTGMDALAIQMLEAKMIDSLPVGELPDLNGGNNQQTTTTPQQTTTTTEISTQLTTTTTVNGNTNNGIKDYGTPMNANATAVEDFRDGSSKLFFASDGWTNGSCFDCGWYELNTSLDNNMLSLTIDKDYTGKYNYSGAEYRTHEHYGYGYYETSMQAIKNDGVVSSFFTYTGESEQNPWDEIDIEILGKDTTKVQLNYYTNGVGNHEFMYDLGFDASEGFHTYGFDWQADYIAWYVDGKEVYRATSNIPSTPGRIMMNTWPGITVDEWLKPFNGNTPLTAHYQWVTFDEKK